MTTFEHLEELVVSLTLEDRPKNKAKWLTQGLRRIDRDRLIAYWRIRLSKQAPKDMAMYAEILEGYKVALARRGRLAERIKNEQQKQQAALDKLKDLSEGGSSTLGATEMAKTAVTAVAKWVGSGFTTASETVIEARKKICSGCEHWDATALKQTGRCRKCGCSTWAKIRMATESCPEGKWGAEA